MSASYIITQHGDLAFQTVSKTLTSHATPLTTDQQLGLFFDSEDGVLLKHGAADLVSAYADKVRASYSEAGLKDLADTLELLVLPVIALHEDSVREEVNKAIEITGYATDFAAKLQAVIANLDPAARAAIEAHLAIPA